VGRCVGRWVGGLVGRKASIKSYKAVISTATAVTASSYNPPELISRFACPNLGESKCSKYS
jgi:hypothetical protein